MIDKAVLAAEKSMSKRKESSHEHKRNSSN